MTSTTTVSTAASVAVSTMGLGTMETATTSEEYIQMDEKYSCAGMTAHPVNMVRGQGEFLWDMDGKKYIDFNAGFSACNQGHCHPKIVAAMVQQCQQLALPSRSVHVPQYALFCKKLCALTGFDKVAALNGGAEATDMAIKIARAWGYKVKGIPQDEAIVLTAVDGYHGRILSLLSGSTYEAYRKDLGPWMPNYGPHCAGNLVRFGNLQDLEDAFQACGDRIAAFMVECVQGQGGCLAASDAYLVGVRRLCSQYNVLFIADDIQGGLGRAGALMSYDSAGIQPDAVILGKSLTGGLYPMSAVVGTKAVMDSLNSGQYGSTFSGNPLVCSVAIAALDVIIDEKLPARSADLGQKFEARFKAFKSPYFDKVTGKGLFRSIYVHETHPQGKVTGKKLAALCLKRGLIINDSGRRLRVCPSLVIDEKVMHEGIDILEQALNDLPNMD